jgi:DNA-binding LacI/PurR family transcriptional regulator
MAERCAQELIAAISNNAPAEGMMLFPHTMIRRESFAELP